MVEESFRGLLINCAPDPRNGLCFSFVLLQLVKHIETLRLPVLSFKRCDFLKFFFGLSLLEVCCFSPKFFLSECSVFHCFSTCARRVCVGTFCGYSHVLAFCLGLFVPLRFATGINSLQQKLCSSSGAAAATTKGCCPMLKQWPHLFNGFPFSYKSISRTVHVVEIRLQQNFSLL